MNKPRVIIADTDATYTVPLQLKFVEEFFNRIELEIITDQGYFDQLFSAPQTVDVLIVSENLYSIGLQRHNIKHTFLMQEELEQQGGTDSLTVNPIDKYSSIKEIFNEIVGKSAHTFSFDDSKKNQTSQVILITSAAGGVGKTTVAMGLCAALTRNYKRTLYINADRLQNFQTKLGNPAPITASDVYARLLTGSKNIFSDIRHVVREEVFQYFPPFKAALMSVGLNYRIYEDIALSAKQSQSYDYIIIDADCSFDEEKARLIGVADRVIIVTNQTKSAVAATNRLYESINGASSEKFLFICNDFDRDAENALTDPALKLRFAINEYIQHITSYDKKSIEAMAKEKDIQKLAYLLI